LEVNVVSIRVKVFLIITAIVLAITLSTVVISVSAAQNQIIKIIENDMLLVSSLADELITNGIDLLKANASTAAQVIRYTPNEELFQVLREQIAAYENFIGLTILSPAGRVDASWGEETAPGELAWGEYGRMAFSGEQVISTSYKTPSGELVFYILVPIEMWEYREGDDAHSRILAVTISGMSFSNMVNKYRIWESGHITIDDNEGTILANIRPEWVLNRLNFIEQAKTNSQYNEVAATVRRMIRRETGVGRFSIEGVDRISAFRPISGSKDGWSLAVIAPISESPFFHIRLLLLVSGAFFLGMGLLAAIFASGIIARPFYQIREQNIRLAELSEEAQAASRTKSKFLANMSHEMRTPLNAVIGLSELSLKKEELPPVVGKNLERIYSSGITLLGIVNDLLDISTVESGKFEIINAEYDVPSFINDTVNLNIVRIGSKPIDFHLHIDENLPLRLYGDELRIKQIFNNLLSNAIKYTSSGRVDWTITTERDGDKVWFVGEVKDTGSGIKAEDMDKLFTDYNRLDTKKNRNLEGTGLGLAMSKKMAEYMDGTITVESEYGKGSIFIARILQKYISDQTIGPETVERLKDFQYSNKKRSDNAGLPRVYLPNARVLVVDDVEINLDVAQGMLEPYGMQVDCALGGREAISFIRKGEPRYDAIFMDHMMPDIDGFETVRIIRNEIGTDYAKNVPIIALTANAISGNNQKFLDGGFQDFLSKPMDILRLDEVIRRWLKGKEKEKESSGAAN
jgi:signal transduction histidine kinase/CheY-like chemotaxis protein